MVETGRRLAEPIARGGKLGGGRPCTTRSSRGSNSQGLRRSPVDEEESCVASIFSAASGPLRPSRRFRMAICWSLRGEETRRTGIKHCIFPESGSAVPMRPPAAFSRWIRSPQASMYPLFFWPFFSIPANVATNAATYGNLALSHPNLAEVGFDDFVSQCEKTHLGPGELSSLLETVASNLKSRSLEGAVWRHDLPGSTRHRRTRSTPTQ